VSWSRALWLLFLSILGSIVSTGLSPLTQLPLPDLALLTALYAGLTSRHSGGALAAQRDASALGMLALGAAIGYATDLVEGTPHGLRALGMAILLLLLHRVAGQLLVGGWPAQGAVAALAMLLFRLLLTVIMLIADGERTLLWSGLRGLPMQLLLTVGVAPLVLSVLSRIDARLWSKTTRPGLRT
jgi:cell shape-determining protein MreD